MKRIAVCFDGTWSRPEENIREDFPTNVLKFARAIRPTDGNGVEQVVFYDWGIGSYHDELLAGATGHGLEKNVMDGYRFLVHNYEPGDDIFLFGFSRGAYTARSLCGMINNCSILRKENANLIPNAFKLYKTRKHKANGDHSMRWKRQFSLEERTPILFVGVWDTVGALGLPFTFFGLIKDQDLFYDRKIGSNVKTARHALSLDEHRESFEPTLWEPRTGTHIGLQVRIPMSAADTARTGKAAFWRIFPCCGWPKKRKSRSWCSTTRCQPPPTPPPSSTMSTRASSGYWVSWCGKYPRYTISGPGCMGALEHGTTVATRVSRSSGTRNATANGRRSGRSEAFHREGPFSGHVPTALPRKRD